MNDRYDFLRLFAGEKEVPRHFTVLSREGHSLLYLPQGRRMADATLRLYPAQSFFARSLVFLVRGFMHVGVQVTSKVGSFPIDEETPFSQFLKQVVPGSKGVPNFGIFANRLKESGRPYVLLLFDAADQPVAVVKVGTTKEARRLIRGEQEFFFPGRPQFPSLPEALGQYEGVDASAIAYRYVEGFSPKPPQHEKIKSLLNSWVRDDEPAPLTKLPIWAKLEDLLQDNPGLEPVFQVLRNARARPVLFHGDFAPWNIRVTSSSANGAWVALDWERGAHRGIPGWDWLNFVVQYNIWVRRLSSKATLEKIESLWGSPEFQDYARRTGMEPVIKELTFVYLTYSLRHFNLRVKITELLQLLQEFNKKYFPNVVLLTQPLKISVVTPSYKQLPWLKLCAASVADQEGVTVEHIIQDAQSGPDLEEWVRQNTKAQLYIECDTGMYDAINRGFARATGDIVCWLNSDEQYMEGTLAKVARYFETHLDIDVLFGDALLISNTGALLSYRRTILPSLRHIQASHLNILSCATFVRRSVLERGYKLDTHWRAIADAVWVGDLLKGGVSMAVLNEPLSVFTITDTNLGQSSLAEAEAKRWQGETASRSLWFRLYLIAWHRFNKLLNGAYVPRSVATRLYTLSSPQQRVPLEASYLGFRWPRKL